MSPRVSRLLALSLFVLWLAAGCASPGASPLRGAELVSGALELADGRVSGSTEADGLAAVPRTGTTP